MEVVIDPDVEMGNLTVESVTEETEQTVETEESEESEDEDDSENSEDENDTEQEHMAVGREDGLRYFELEILRLFCGHLQCGEYLKNRKSAVQHTKQVFNIWGECPGEGYLLEHILNVEFIVEQWIPKALDSHLKVGSVKSNLYSYVLFLEFLLTKERYDPIKLSIAKTRIQRASRRLKKRVGQRRCEIETKDINRMPSQDDVCTFLGSNYVKEIERKFEEIPVNLCQKEYNSMLGYLIFRILVANGQRSGAILGITDNVLTMAQRKPDGFIIQVGCLEINSMIHI